MPPPSVLVMTSGNLSEEPIAIGNDEARIRLSNLADAFLMHNRPIYTRCDDSVMRIISLPETGSDSQVTLLPMRRSRGYAPFPVYLPWKPPSILAVGAELKNTFCVTRERHAFMSHHIGDLENYETLSSFEEGISHFERIFRIKPELIAYDLHPDYLSTRYARRRSEQENIQSFGIQHHHAHIASCMVENGLNEERLGIGISLDGTGFGIDGAIWGGEFLLADYRGFQRAAHLRYTRLPGGEKAIREPWRMALAWLSEVNLNWDENLPPVRFALEKQTLSSTQQNPRDNLGILHHQLMTGLNSPFTSSMGRLFDAVAALIGVRFEANYEAQAAIELESLVDPNESNCYDFSLLTEPAQDHIQFLSGMYTIQDAPLLSNSWIVDPGPIFVDILRDLNKNRAIQQIAARFHNTIAKIVVQICDLIATETGVSEVFLSGGVWQNKDLLRKTIPMLSNIGLKVYTHQRVPCNDGGIALGQAAIAANAKMK
jgi:hydrogenase maturation protein HypF